jgi:uncharacterized protein YqfA (UPF0365 family)
MDYYNLQNIISDTQMRDTISKAGKPDVPESIDKKS